MKGLQKGIQKGIKKGRQEGARALFVDLLSDRFGPLPPDLIERVESATPEAFQQLRSVVWTASSLDDLFSSK